MFLGILISCQPVSSDLPRHASHLECRPSWFSYPSFMLCGNEISCVQEPRSCYSAKSWDLYYITLSLFTVQNWMHYLFLFFFVSGSVQTTKWWKQNFICLKEIHASFRKNCLWCYILPSLIKCICLSFFSPLHVSHLSVCCHHDLHRYR